jgi:hypothetical protein
VTATLVRGGENTQIDNDPETGVVLHNAENVFGEMLMQVAREYSGLPDVRGLTFSELAYFYGGLRGDLKRSTKG